MIFINTQVGSSSVALGLAASDRPSQLESDSDPGGPPGPGGGPAPLALRLVQVARARPGPAATNARARPAGTRTQATNLKQATILRAASSPNLKRDYSR